MGRRAIAQFSAEEALLSLQSRSRIICTRLLFRLSGRNERGRAIHSSFVLREGKFELDRTVDVVFENLAPKVQGKLLLGASAHERQGIHGSTAQHFLLGFGSS